MSKRPSSIYNDPGYFYSGRKIIRIFTIVTALLMIGILWWVWIDFDRQWKDEQRHEMRWQARKLAVESFVLKHLTKDDRARIEKMQEDAVTLMQEREAEIAELDKELSEARGAFYGADMDFKEQKQYTTEAEYNVHEAHSPKGSAEWDRRHREEKDLEDRLRDNRQSADEKLKEVLGRHKLLHKELEDIVTAQRANPMIKRLEIVSAGIKKNATYNPAREIPLLDFLAPPTKVEQIVLDNLVDNYEFATPKKVDRCGTCHIGSMNVGYEARKWPTLAEDETTYAPKVFEEAVYRFLYSIVDSVTRPANKKSPYLYEETLQRRVDIHHATLGLMFEGYDPESGDITLDPKRKGRKVWRKYKAHDGTEVSLDQYFVSMLGYFERQWHTHPHFNDMVGSSSPHPYDSFGCTSCHQGRGWSVDFGLSYHTPDRIRIDNWMTDELAKAEGYHVPESAGLTLDEAMATGNVPDPEGGAEKNPFKVHVGWVTDNKTGHEWEENRGWTHTKRHHWVWPQFPKTLVQSSCLKCHKEGLYRTARPEYENLRIGKPDVDAPDTFDWEDHSLAMNEGQADLPTRFFIPKDPEPYRPRNLERGMDNFLRYGCYGCHKLDPKSYPFMKNVRTKAGPQLDTVATKTDKRWARKWVRDPKTFRHDTRMPRFFGLSNSSHSFKYRFADEGFDKVDGNAWSDAEIYAIVEWIWDESAKKSKPLAPLDLSKANPANGEAILRADAQATNNQAKACIACHSIPGTSQGEQDAVAEHLDATSNATTGWKPRMSRRQGPDLTGVGSKVTAEWLFSWLKDPRGYWHETNMPDLRLTDQEALDIVAYLTQQKHAAFDKLPDVPRHQHVIDKIAEELRVGEQRESTHMALGIVKGWKPRERTLYVGKKLFKHYGCFGCHEVEEYRNATPIGTELTEWGSKLIDRLLFNHAPIEHTRFDFAYLKMINPRIYDWGMPQRDRPFERLKMPRFGFTPDEARDLATFLVGLVNDPVPEKSLFRPDARQKDIIRGRQVMRRYNCQGCHVIEGEGGDIWPAIDNAKWRPPDLLGQGGKTNWHWLFQFMKDPAFVTIPGVKNSDRVRPWHSIRMPTFHLTDEEARALVRYFSALSNVPADFETEPVDRLTGPGSKLKEQLTLELSDPDNRERKYKQRVSNRLEESRAMFQEYQCKSCHSPAAPIANAAPDFRHSRAGRLRPEWIVDWLWGPLKLQPGTAMPMFFATEDGPVAQDQQFFDGNPERQILALRDYIRHHYREEDR